MGGVLKLKGSFYHLLLNLAFWSLALYGWSYYSERMGKFKYGLLIIGAYLTIMHLFGGIKALREYFVIKRGKRVQGRIVDFVFGMQVLGISGYYPIIEYREGERTIKFKYRAYRGFSKKHPPSVTLYIWKDLVVPLEFSEWKIS